MSLWVALLVLYFSLTEATTLINFQKNSLMEGLKSNGLVEKEKPTKGDADAIPPKETFLGTPKFIPWKLVSELNDDNILIKILNEKEGCENANEGAMVVVRHIGKLQDGTKFLKGQKDDGELFESKTNENQLIEGLDRIVLMRRKDGIALLGITPEYLVDSNALVFKLASISNVRQCYAAYASKLTTSEVVILPGQQVAAEIQGTTTCQGVIVSNDPEGYCLQVSSTYVGTKNKGPEASCLIRWDPGNHFCIASKLSSFLFKIWDPGGSLCFPKHHLEDKVNL